MIVTRYYFVRLVYFTYLWDVSNLHIGVIIHLLSTMDIPVVFQIPPYVFGLQIPTVWKSRELGVAISQDSSDHQDHYMFSQGYRDTYEPGCNYQLMRGIKQHMYGKHFPKRMKFGYIMNPEILGLEGSESQVDSS